MTERLAGRVRALALLLLAGTLLPGHSPYVQWYAYRAKHLVVVTDEATPGAFAAASSVASALAARWPQSKAVAAVARSPREVVSLLRSGQLQIGLLPANVALDAFEGRGAFSATGKVQLRAVAVVGGDLLVVMEGYPRENARTIARALREGRAGADRAPPRSPIPFHPGALDDYAARQGG